jgi:Protein of unknown function (DUF2652)
MELINAFIVLIDISGYTKFIRMHKVSLIHAEGIISELLESVIDASSHPLILNKLQGDAALFYAPSDGRRETAREILRQIEGFFGAFAAREKKLISECSLCSCDACLKVGQLKLKAIAHHGEVAVKQIKQFTEIAGEDVILAHRLLKNTVNKGEYILLSKTLDELSGGINGRVPDHRREECEGVGAVDVVVYYPESDTGSDAAAVRSETSIWDKLRMALKLEGLLVKRLVTKPARKFDGLARSQGTVGEGTLNVQH